MLCADHSRKPDSSSSRLAKTASPGGGVSGDGGMVDGQPEGFWRGGQCTRLRLTAGWSVPQSHDLPEDPESVISALATGVPISAFSYGPCVPEASRGPAFHVLGTTHW